MPGTIRRGSTGEDVKAWQAVLLAAGKPGGWRSARGIDRSWPWPWPISADGLFGERTEAATEAWQHARGLEADGVVGPRTWAAAGSPPVTPEESQAPLLRGTDISAIQGKLAPSTWMALRDLGIRFAIMRSVVGNEQWVDGAYMHNLRLCEEFGIAGGLYLFAFPLRHIDPVKQADDWFRKVERFGAKAGEMPLALDLEWPPREERAKDGTIVYPWRDKWKIDGPFIRSWGLRCAERLEALSGAPPLLYTYRYFWDCLDGKSVQDFANFPLWLADYGFGGRWPAPAEVAKKKAPGPWSEIAIMQHDGNGGLKLPTGMDADFNIMTGGESRLAALLARPHDTLATPAEGEAAEVAATLETTIQDSNIAAYRAERFREEPTVAA